MIAAGVRSDRGRPQRLVVGDGDATTTTTDDSTTTSTTTTTTPEPSTTTPATVTPLVRRPIITDRDGRWKLFAADSSTRHCVELVVDKRTYGSLLCDSGPARRPVGDAAVVDVGADRMLVAVADRSLTGFTGYPRAAGAITNDAGQVGTDATRGVSYIAGLVALGSHPVVDVLLFSGEDTVGRVLVPEASGPVPADRVDLNTSPPYGRWPGYRRAGSSGYWQGGLQEVGFYDGPDGAPCVLYRRFGASERQLVDACPGRRDGVAVADGFLVPDTDANVGFQAVIVIDGPATGWTCEVPPSGRCVTSPLLRADPKGTGRSVGVPLASALPWPSADSVTLLALNGGNEVGRLVVPVPGHESGSTTSSTTSTSTSTSTTSP